MFNQIITFKMNEDIKCCSILKKNVNTRILIRVYRCSLQKLDNEKHFPGGKNLQSTFHTFSSFCSILYWYENFLRIMGMLKIYVFEGA